MECTFKLVGGFNKCSRVYPKVIKKYPKYGLLLNKKSRCNRRQNLIKAEKWG